jgi:hypothetical protein
MPLPKNVLGTAAHLGGYALPAAFSFVGVKSRIREGQNPVFAAAIEGGNLALQLLLTGPETAAFYFGIPLARAGAAMITDQVTQHNNYIRQARTPFSQRFEHSETTARAQAAGMRAIGAAWGHAHMGSEAALFARRYGR